MDIPGNVQNIIEALESANHTAYAVGGCVRDLLLGIAPKDWDVATSATPAEVQKLFPDSFYENMFGTVGVKTESENPSLAVVEVTTFRFESSYSDRRHPDAVTFAKTIEEDLARRDFTINAMALSLLSAASNQQSAFEIIDPYGGRNDLKNKFIQAVGKAEERFSEDALRMMRAVRLAAELDFTIEPETLRAIQQNAKWLERIAKERVRDELERLLTANGAADGIRLLEDVGLLAYVLPELRDGIGITQNLHHIYTVFDHNVRALAYAAKKNYTFEVRLASLLHDVGKPRTKRGDGHHATFYGHDVVGAAITRKMLERLRFSSEVVQRVELLVRHHLFYYNVGEVTASSVRRLLKNVGPENIEDLVRVREADRIGSGVPKAVPYKLRHFKYMVEKVSKDPISVKMLAIDGTDVMRVLAIEPGPKVGLVLNALLGEVLEDPKKNMKEYLEARAAEFGMQSAEDLKRYLEIKEKKVQAEEEEMRKKYYV